MNQPPQTIPIADHRMVVAALWAAKRYIDALESYTPARPAAENKTYQQYMDNLFRYEMYKEPILGEPYRSPEQRELIKNMGVNYHT